MPVDRTTRLEQLLKSYREWLSTGDDEHYQDLYRILDYKGEDYGC